MAINANVGVQQQNSEAHALSDIITWAGTRCLWQQDALRRLCQFAELSDADILELVEICKGNAGIVEPISNEHIRDPEALTKRVELECIHDVENVNALAAKQKLQFAKKGVTVVYGDNGSGKSGYTRILKQVCRTRDSNASTILPNVYNTNSGVPKAHIDFIVSGEKQTTEWVKDQNIEPLLSSIGIFDSNAASIHVDNANDIAYLPFPVSLLNKLAEACKEVKSKLQEEIALQGQTPSSISSPKCHSHTVVGQMIATLSSNTKPQTIEDLAGLNNEGKKRLDKLRSDLYSDPQVTIRRLNAKLDRINELYYRENELSVAILSEKHAQLKLLHGGYLQCKNLAELAATKLFDDEPLPNVGGAEWKALWDAARRYSENVEYVDQAFPVIDGDDAYCLLCQQGLDVKAKERLKRFQDFVADDTKQQEALAFNSLQEFKNTLTPALLSRNEILQFVNFCKNELNNDDLAKEVRAFFIKGKWRLRALLNMQETLPATPILPKDVFDKEKTEINSRISSLADDDAISARQALIKEKENLEDREWLQTMKDDIIAEIVRKKNIEELESIISTQAVTNQITRKSTEISKILVSDSLKSRFTEEVDKMKLPGLSVELQQEPSSYGMPMFKVSLLNNPDAKVAQVLSEGEFRCVALAAFLADLATTNSKSAIVFDDPISSLDYEHRGAVAKRLASEALTRQVIVFTHNPSFLILLEEFCRENQSEIHHRHVVKFPETGEAGICRSDAPSKVQSVEKRINSLNNRLKKERIFYEQGDEAKWTDTADDLLKGIRITWERAVENIVGVVLTRFGHKVNTTGLTRLTILTDEDCKVMRDAYGRCSRKLHSESVEFASDAPPPANIQEEIEILENWYEGIRAKQKSVKED